MRFILSSFLILSLLVGCSPQSSPRATEANFAELITLSTADVVGLTKSVKQPLIVEFSVLHGCARCAEMRPQVCQLAMEQSDQISIVRADFTTNHRLLQSLGATVCPTYVLFTPGDKPQIHTSPELLISMANVSTDAANDERMQ